MVKSILSDEADASFSEDSDSDVGGSGDDSDSDPGSSSEQDYVPSASTRRGMVKDVAESHPFVKVNTVKRVNREARIYRHLMRVGFAGCPRYGGTRQCDAGVGRREKQILLERMFCSLNDYTNTYAPCHDERLRGGKPASGDPQCMHHDPPARLPRDLRRRHWTRDETMNPIKDLDDVWDKAFQLALILETLHSPRVGYCHRDVKPENICIDRNGLVRLIDYEFCVRIRHPPGSNLSASRAARLSAKQWCQYRGTRMYAPPEIVAQASSRLATLRRIEKEFGGLPYGAECESWCFGVTFLEMYSGVDLNSPHVVKSVSSQRQLDALVKTLVEARSAWDRRDREREAESARNLVALLTSACLRLNWRERLQMSQIASHEAFKRHVPDKRRVYLRRRNDSFC